MLRLASREGKYVFVTLSNAEEVLSPIAVQARNGLTAILPAIERLDAPIYVTDERGLIIYFNQQCVGFAGRQPVSGKDQWCVTWKLYDLDGSPLPHDQCPMAGALKSGRPVRGAYADAERPDGTRVRFQPFPTPLYDADGRLIGAVNILLDISDFRQIEDLRTNAERCRRLSISINDYRAVATFRTLASEYEAKALDLIRHNNRN
jgi:PAS domain-containing protein